MKQNLEFPARVALLVFIWMVWWWVINLSLSNLMNLSCIVAGVLLTFPCAWLGRKILDRNPTMNRAVWVTTFVHLALGFTFGIPIIRAVITVRDWTDWILPIPKGIGLTFVIVTDLQASGRAGAGRDVQFWQTYGHASTNGLGDHRGGLEWLVSVILSAEI